MTNYSRSAYGSDNPNDGYPANGNTGAWGGYEWPNCAPSSLMGTTDYTSTFGQRMRVTLRKELVELATLMFKLADKHGYCLWANKDGENWGPWGAECRAISGTNNPSGHSKALSMDWNAPYNPYSYTFQSDMPPAMVADIENCGWYWGGRYEGQKYDAMHYGYCHTPAEVGGHVERAKQLLGGFSPAPEPEVDMSSTASVLLGGQPHVFVVGRDKKIYERWPDANAADGGGWSPWTPGVPGEWTGGLSVLGPDLPQLWGVGGDGKTVMTVWSSGDKWNGPVAWAGIDAL